nr:putative ribonuclease H-like domain-containing protein [Tanacetum cinerariifolium]
MPPRPDLVFHTAPIAIETTHSAFTVQPSSAKPTQDISHATRPMAPIIEDWVSDSEDEFEPNDPQSAPSFVQTYKHAKLSGHYVLPIKASILETSPNSTNSKTKDFKLPDENQVLLREPRENNIYNVNLKDIVPFGDLTCLFAKATIDESNLWHRRLGHVNFKNINKLVKGNLVKGLPAKVFENQNNCVACKKGKQHRASCKTKPNNSVTQPLFRLRIDLFGPTFIKSLRIKREFSVPRTPQQNGIAERKNKTLIEAARTMLADSLLPIPFWAEAVNTACYVQNRVLVTKPQNKTPYELLHGRPPSIGFMRPFGCHVIILNTLDSLGKFEGKVDKGFLVGYSVNSKAFRVFNSRTRIVQETLHVNFLENKANIASTGPTWLFDIYSLTRTMNYQPVTAGNQSNPSAGFQEEFDAEKIRKEAIQQYMLFLVWSTGSTNPQNKEGDATFDGNEHSAEHPESTVNLSPSSNALSGEQDDITKKRDKGKSHVDYFIGNKDFNEDFEDYSEDSSNDVSVVGPIVPTARQNYFNSTNPISAAGPSNSNTSPIHGNSSFQDTSQSHDMLENKDIVYSDHENVGADANFNNLETSITVSPIPTTRTHNAHPISQIIGRASSVQNAESLDLGCLPHGKRVIGTKWVYKNKKDEKGIVVRNKARLVAQGHTQEEEIDYEEVFAPVARIEAIRLFLAYASFMGFMVYQMNVKSAFLYGTIEEEVYVCQPSGFEDPDHHDKVYKVVKALYGLHQAPRAWYETLATYLLKNGFHRGQIDQTLFIKKQKRDILLMQIYKLTEASILVVLDCNLPFELMCNASDYAIGAVLRQQEHYIKSTTGGCQFLGSRLISWQCKKQTVVATSSTEAEYVAGASCCAQVLWIQNQMLDY